MRTDRLRGSIHRQLPQAHQVPYMTSLKLQLQWIQSTNTSKLIQH